MKNLSFDIEKVRQGDWASFHRLFKVLYPRLITLASRFVDECTAEDLVQNVFLFYWERKETIDINDIKSFGNYIRLYTTNQKKQRDIMNNITYTSLLSFSWL